MNLDEIRIAVRTQLDVDEEELPNALIDLYARDASDHIAALETRWPGYEVMWSVPTVANEATVALPADSREVDSVVLPNVTRLIYIDSRYAEEMLTSYGGSSASTPKFWSRFGQSLYLWPNPDKVYDLSLRGYRATSDWVAEGASGVPDFDPRLHLSIVWFACSLAYAQQEDEVLEATYMARYRETAQLVHQAIMRAWSGQPKVLNRYRYAGERAPSVQSVVFSVPGS